MSLSPRGAYEALLARHKERALLESCATLLAWDEETMMPRRGLAHRAEQSALLAGLEHRLATDPALPELIARAREYTDDPIAVANVREIARLHQRARRLDQRLVEETARVLPQAQGAWAEARERDDFAHLEPWLTRVVALERQEAALLVEPGQSPYETALGEYEPGLSLAELEALFDTLGRALTPLVAHARAQPEVPAPSWTRGPFPLEAQHELARSLLAWVGFSLEAGRLDTALHPFTVSIGVGDVRLATRYADDDLEEVIYTTLHEGGHALYDQGLDPAHHGTPYGTPSSLALHEAQARLWETCVGRSAGFARYLAPRVRALFPSVLGDVDERAWVRWLRRITTSPLRASADEVTYDVHILIRYRLERALLEGTLEVRDLPAAWEEAYLRELGVRPARPAHGVLQDGHWPSGMFGYFPTYTLGNLIAAQLMEAAERDLGPLEPAMARGELAPLLGWLRAHVHAVGPVVPMQGRVQAATGSPLGVAPLVRLLEARVREG